MQPRTETIPLAQRIPSTREPFAFFHTWTVSEDLLSRAIREQRSMDLDVCIDDGGRPYLGHSREYHEKSGEPVLPLTPPLESSSASLTRASL
jgi:hypothetical protein